MLATELRKFDTRLWVTDPWVTRLRFYGLGATVVAPDRVVPAGTSQLPVHDAGNLTGGATVKAGLSGPTLSVTSVSSRTLITVSNPGASFTIVHGTRLILISDPVRVYTNSEGTAAITDGSALEVTSENAPVVWIPRPTFDLTAIPEVAVDAVSTVQTLAGGGSSLNWSHTASGSNRLVIVAISWFQSTGDDAIDTVTYDGVAMTQLAGTPYHAVYYLLDPPTGSKSVVVTWTGASSKGAVAASASFSNVKTADPIASSPTASGSSTTPSVAVNTNAEQVEVFNLLSVEGGPVVTVTPGSALTQRWNASATAGSTTFGQGAGATLDSGGVSTNLTWTLGQSRAWSMIAVALRPPGPAGLTISTPGGITVGQTFVDARNYSTPQSALEDVPVGGTVMFPNGDYTVQSGGIIIRKTMELRGEPGTRLLTYGAAANQSVIRIEPGGQLLEWVKLRKLTLQNLEKPASPIAGNHGLFCDVPTDHSKIGNLTLEQVRVKFMGDDGIRLTAHGDNDSYFVFVTMRSCRSEQNRGRGLFVSTANLFEVYGSFFLGNDLDGFRGENSEIEFHSTGFEDNCKTSDTGRISATLNGQLSLKACPLSIVMGCHVENFTAPGRTVCRRGIVIEGGGCATIMSNRIVGVGVGPDSPPEDSDSTVRGIYITGAAMACSVQSNAFVQVKTAVEIDGGAGLAKDCVVAPQRIEYGTGEVKIPIGVSNSGLTVLGNRRLGTDTVPELARGMFVPPHDHVIANGVSSLPTLTSTEVGYMLFDTTNKTLLVWNGADWMKVQLALV